MNADKLYLNPKLPVEDRVKDLLARMSLTEKIAQMNMQQIGSFQQDKVYRVDLAEMAVGKNGIGAIDTVGTMITLGLTCKDIAALTYDIQKYLVQQTRLGIPALIVGEGLHGFVASEGTMYPQSIGVGGTFNRELVHRMGKAIAKEARCCGVNQLFAPNLDIARELRWGRVEETYGEDPYLIGELGTEYVNGMQGKSEYVGKENVVATLKHFVAHGDPQGGINLAPVAGGERLLRELYLKPFKKVLKNTHVLSVMPAYSEYDGVPVTASPYLLRKVLREELGFKGYTVSDYGAIEMLHNFHLTAETGEEAGKQAIKAGIDLEAPESVGYTKLFKEMVENGEVDEDLIDEAVGNILRVKFLAGLFENPFGAIEEVEEILNCQEHKTLAYEVACESIVLLKNKGNILPLSKSKKTIAVIGPNAKKVQLGDYATLKPDAMSLLKGLELELEKGNEIEILYHEGCDLYSQDKSRISEAVDIAKQADMIIVAVGESSMALCGVGWGSEDSSKKALCGEGYDRTDLELPGVQQELVDALIEINKPLITVLINGRPLSVTRIVEKSDAVIEAWYPGEEGGRALADIIFGKVNPSGKLCVSVPKTVGQAPVYYNHKPSARGRFYKKPGSLEEPGRDYVFMDTKALFDFGFGLSYTTFQYSDITLSKQNIKPYESVEISINVKNTGDRKGKESVLLFINDLYSSVTTPIQVLCGFEKIELEAQEEKVVVFVIKKEHLALFDVNMQEIIESGEFEVTCGSEKTILTVLK